MTGRRDRSDGAGNDRTPNEFGSARVSGNGTSGPDFSQSETLKRAIEHHVIPTVRSSDAAHLVPGLDPDIFYEMLLDLDDSKLRTVVPTLVEHDVSFDEFYDVLLQPVFERMQADWFSDAVDFLSIDLASARVQMICNSLIQQRLDRRGAGREDGRTVLLANSSEDTHTMGIYVVRALFLEAGWVVDGGAHISPKAGLYETIGTSRYDLLALSSGYEGKAFVRDIVARARRASLNDELAVCVGGPSVTRSPRDFSDVGADIVADQPNIAVTESTQLIPHPGHRFHQ